MGIFRLFIMLWMIGTIATAEPEPFSGLTLILRDGVRVTGNTDLTHFAIQSDLMSLNIPIGRIATIQPAPGKEGKVSLVLFNGDVVDGVPEADSLVLWTEAGRREISFAQISSVTVFPGSGSPQGLAKGLVVQFDFEEVNGATVPNLAQSTPPAVLHAGIAEGGVVTLDGTDDHVMLANDAGFEELEAMSVSIWMCIGSFEPGGYGNEHGYLVNKGDDMWWNPGWCLGYSKGSWAGREDRPGHPGPFPAVFTIGTEKRGTPPKCQLWSKTLLEKGRWYHLAGTYDGEVACLYVDGILERETPYTGKLRRDSAPLLLGGGKLGGTDFGNHFTVDAAIDNFRLYQRALTRSEVRQLTQIEKRPVKKQ